MKLFQQDIINRNEFNALMKYENMEFERNCQLEPNVRSTNEPNTSVDNSSVRPNQHQTKKTHDDIQVIKYVYLIVHQWPWGWAKIVVFSY